MDDEAQRRGVIAGAHLLGQGEEAVEHGGNQVGVGDTVAVDQAQGLLRVPPVHEHHRHPAEEGNGQGEGQRGGVVERARAQMDVLTRAVPVHGDGSGRGAGADGLAPVHPLGAPGGARRVEHGGTEHGVLEVGDVLLVGDRLVAVEALDLASDGQAHRRSRGPLGRSQGQVRQAGVGDEGLGVAVGRDVSRLLGREMPVDAGEPQPGPVGGGVRLDELGTVGAQKGDPVPLLQAPGLQRPGQLVGPGVELPEAAVAVGGDDGRPSRLLLGYRGDRHPSRLCLEVLPQISHGEPPRHARSGAGPCPPTPWQELTGGSSRRRWGYAGLSPPGPRRVAVGWPPEPAPDRGGDQESEMTPEGGRADALRGGSHHPRRRLTRDGDA